MTDFTDAQVILVMAIVAAAVLFVLLDRWQKEAAQQQLRRLRAAGAMRPKPLGPSSAASPRRSYSPVPRSVVPTPIEQRPQLVPAIISQFPKKLALEPETVTIEFPALLDQATRPAAPGIMHKSATLPDFTPALPAFTPALPAFTIDAELWERLIAKLPSHDLLTAGAEPAHAETPAVLQASYEVIDNDALDSDWPQGIIPQSALQKLLAGEKPFTGQVVSIGVNDVNSQDLMHSIAAYLGDQLRPNDFCCRTDYDEFILACPGDTGAPAQRHLSHLAERLWDFQLRGVGARSILFSWGAVQVQDQPLAEAIASAVDRMRQTKRLSTGSTLTRAYYAAV